MKSSSVKCFNETLNICDRVYIYSLYVIEFIYTVYRLVKIDEKYGKPQKNCNRIILEIFQS